MKRIFIVHGWGDNPKGNWHPWLKKELEKKGYKVIVPEMPNTLEPKIEEWVSHLKKVVEKLDEETYFIGHSIGCQTIMRFLENEPFNRKIPKVVFIAGWFKLKNLEDEEKPIAKPWLESPIHLEKVKNKIKEIIVFLSSNEPYNYIEENESIFKNKLGAKVTILKNKGHFTKEEEVMEIKEITKEF